MAKMLLQERDREKEGERKGFLHEKGNVRRKGRHTCEEMREGNLVGRRGALLSSWCEPFSRD